MIGHIIFLISFASVVLMTAYLSTTAEYYRRQSEKLKKENEQLKKELSFVCKTFETMKNCFNCGKMIKGTREKCKDCITSKDYKYWEFL